MAIYGNCIGGSSSIGKTVEITSADGIEIIGVVTGQEEIFDATVNDVRKGKKFASSDGILVGEKDILNYRTTRGKVAIRKNKPFVITNLEEYNRYDYTALQCIISTSTASAKMVIMNDYGYYTNSLTPIDSNKSVIKDGVNKSIDLNIGTNDTESICYINYFTYREDN